MHQPSLEKRFSVFYDYEIFPLLRPPEMEDASLDKPVAIVGAGPVGMVLALLLAKQGIASTLIESKAQVSNGSRAVALTRRSVEILQQAGAEKPFVANGFGWNSGVSFFRGERVFEMKLPQDPDDRFPPILNNSQQCWGECLVDACARDPLIDLRWQTKLIRITDGEGGVALGLDTPDGPYDLRANWAVACDGGRSAVRKEMGLRMVGTACDGKFVITDFRAPDLDLPVQRYCYFDSPWNSGTNVLVHRQPNDIWRFDYRLPDDESREYALAPVTIATRTRRIMEMIGQVVEWEPDWATICSPNALTLPDFRRGHVLFSGDAAHMLPIFGIRGTNTGFQDAENLAWKLAAVVKGEGTLALLDSYSSERVRAAHEICDEADKSTRLMDPPTRGYRVMSEAILQFALTEPFTREMLHWRTSRPHEYTRSPLNAAGDDDAAFAGGSAHGVVGRNLRLGDDDFLFDHFAFGPQLLVFNPEGAALDVSDLAGRHGLRVLAFGSRVSAATEELSVSDAILARFGLTGPETHTCCGRTCMSRGAGRALIPAGLPPRSTPPARTSERSGTC
ncbi:FAD-dependent monooxygenase [Paracoccus sp. (in: a-proteobacteria)]|uniref:FAD-dependent monooxygenase n=1 Tax=Paracoccus sp. TaxID=267 RepID=UPI003A866940